MTPGRISNADAVEAIDSQLRSLYRCFRDFGPNNPHLTTAIRQLHSVLKGLRLEAREPYGPLNTASPAFSGVFSRQLTPILNECDASLKVFATIVRKYRPTLDSRRSNSYGSTTSTGSNSSSDISGHSFGTPVSVTLSPLVPLDYVGKTTDDQLAVVRSRFITHATRLASLLETMKSPRAPYPTTPAPSLHAQSPSPTSSTPHISPPISPISPLPSDDDELETIKDRIDAIAVRLAHQDLVSSSQFNTASINELCSVFYTELTYEGFSSNTLSEYKVSHPIHSLLGRPSPNNSQDNLRAYIQDLGSRGFFKSTDAPSPQPPARGYFHSLLDYIVPGQAPAGLSPKEVVQPFDKNEKYHHGVKDSRLAPQPRDGELHIPYRPAQYSGEPKYIATPPESVVGDQQLTLSSNAMAAPRDDSEEAYNENGFNFISTRRLLDIDWRERELAAGRLVSFTPPHLLEHGSHSSQAFPALAISPTAAAIVRQNSLQSQLSLSPPSPSRSSFFPPTSAGGYNSSVSHGPAAPHAAFGIMIPGGAAPPSPSQIPAGAELGPDSFGNPIPADAVWTRITRKRISPEVLARAGVRFEARPTFVAILGVLSREQIAEYARKSVEARRSWRHSNPRNERRSPTGSSPSDYTSRPERRQTMSGAGGDKHDERGEVAAAGRRSQTFPLASASPSSRSRDSNSSAGTASGSQGKGGAYPFIVSPPATEVDTSGTEGAPKSILKNKNKNKVRYRDGELVEVSPDESSRSRSHRHSRSYGDNHRHRSKSRAKSRYRDADSQSSRRDSSRHRDDEREHRRDGDRSRRREDYDRDSDRERERERDHTRHRSRHRDQEHDSSRRRRHDDDRSHDRERDDARHRDRSRDREQRRDRDHDRERPTKTSSNVGRSHRDGRDGRDGRDKRDGRDGRDSDRDSQDRDGHEKDDGRKRLRDTVNAAGIGGIAGSFFSVLSEAASGF